MESAECARTSGYCERVRGEPFALTCDSCGEPLFPNLSRADADGCLWICIDPELPGLLATAEL